MTHGHGDGVGRATCYRSIEREHNDYGDGDGLGHVMDETSTQTIVYSSRLGDRIFEYPNDRIFEYLTESKCNECNGKLFQNQIHVTVNFRSSFELSSGSYVLLPGPRDATAGTVA